MFNIFVIIYRCYNWLQNCQLFDVLSSNKKHKSVRICSKHFDKTCYDANNKLMDNTTPTIFNWNQDQPIDAVSISIDNGKIN